jgi:hypothetical protein
MTVKEEDAVPIDTTEAQKVAHRLMGVKEECQFCRFWKEEEQPWENEGRCHRYPPRFEGNPNAVGPEMWQTTSPSDWCGEFRVDPKRIKGKK